MVNKERVVLETVKQLLENTELLTEMAYDKQKITDYIDNRLDVLVEHLVLCFAYNDYYGQTVHHWASEIYGILHRTKKLSDTNKLPTKKQYINWCLDTSRKNEIYNIIDGTIHGDKFVQKYKVVPEYDKDKVYDKILKYIDWLFEELSQREEIDPEDVRDEIEILQKL